MHRRDRGWRVRWAVLAAGDLLAACLAYLLSFTLRVVVPFPLTQGYLPAVRFTEVNHHWGELLLAQLATLYFLGLYETRAVLSPRPHLAAIAAAAGLQALVLIAVYFFRQDLLFPRSIFVVFAVLNAALLMIWRLGCSALLGGYPRRRVLVVGTNATAAEVIDTVRGQDVARSRHRRCRRQQLERYAHPGPRVGTGARDARESAGAVRAVCDRRGHHRVRSVLAGSPPRRVQPRARRAVAHLGGAVSLRDPDRPARDAAPARHPAHRGLRRRPRRCRQRHQAALRHGARPAAARPRHSRDAAGRAGGPSHVAGSGDLSADPCRPRRPAVHHPQVPHHAPGGGERHGAGAGDGERPARDPHRPRAARDAPRRAAAAVQRAPGRHELRRSAPGAAGVRPATTSSTSRVTRSASGCGPG